MPTLKLENGEFAPGELLQEEITLQAWRDGARPQSNRAALVLPNDAALEDFADAVPAFSAVVVEFPAFKDGRAFSQARLLRERLGYTGDIRARGDVLRDQVAFMARCGVNVFEIEVDDAEGYACSLNDFTVFYQTAADRAAPVWRLRGKRAVAAA